jgi:hypothetical protein
MSSNINEEKENAPMEVQGEEEEEEEEEEEVVEEEEEEEEVEEVEEVVVAIPPNDYNKVGSRGSTKHKGGHYCNGVLACVKRDPEREFEEVDKGSKRKACSFCFGDGTGAGSVRQGDEVRVEIKRERSKPKKKRALKRKSRSGGKKKRKARSPSPEPETNLEIIKVFNGQVAFNLNGRKNGLPLLELLETIGSGEIVASALRFYAITAEVDLSAELQECEDFAPAEEEIEPKKRTKSKRSRSPKKAAASKRDKKRAKSKSPSPKKAGAGAGAGGSKKRSKKKKAVAPKKAGAGAGAGGSKKRSKKKAEAPKSSGSPKRGRTDKKPVQQPVVGFGPEEEEQPPVEQPTTVAPTEEKPQEEEQPADEEEEQPEPSDPWHSDNHRAVRLFDPTTQRYVSEASTNEADLWRVVRVQGLQEDGVQPQFLIITRRFFAEDESLQSVLCVGVDGDETLATSTATFPIGHQQRALFKHEVQAILENLNRYIATEAEAHGLEDKTSEAVVELLWAACTPTRPETTNKQKPEEEKPEDDEDDEEEEQPPTNEESKGDQSTSGANTGALPRPDPQALATGGGGTGGAEDGEFSPLLSTNSMKQLENVIRSDGVVSRSLFSEVEPKKDTELDVKLPSTYPRVEEFEFHDSDYSVSAPVPGQSTPTDRAVFCRADGEPSQMGPLNVIWDITKTSGVSARAAEPVRYVFTPPGETGGELFRFLCPSMTISNIYPELPGINPRRTVFPGWRQWTHHEEVQFSELYDDSKHLMCSTSGLCLCQTHLVDWSDEEHQRRFGSVFVCPGPTLVSNKLDRRVRIENKVDFGFTTPGTKDTVVGLLRETLVAHDFPNVNYFKDGLSFTEVELRTCASQFKTGESGTTEKFIGLTIPLKSAHFVQLEKYGVGRVGFIMKPLEELVFSGHLANRFYLPRVMRFVQVPDDTPVLPPREFNNIRVPYEQQRTTRVFVFIDELRRWEEVEMETEGGEITGEVSKYLNGISTHDGHYWNPFADIVGPERTVATLSIKLKSRCLRTERTTVPPTWYHAACLGSEIGIAPANYKDLTNGSAECPDCGETLVCIPLDGDGNFAPPDGADEWIASLKGQRPQDNRKLLGQTTLDRESYLAMAVRYGIVPVGVTPSEKVSAPKVNELNRVEQAPSGIPPINETPVVQSNASASTAAASMKKMWNNV